jgi:starch phosphorylase
MSFEEARACIVNSTVFTTHTPVEAGNENFPAEMVGAALRDELDSMGVSPEKILRYGFLHDASTFWLPAFAIRFSRYVNGVSVLHGEVSRRMWKDLFPERLEREIPIDSITNGVHYSWLSPAMRDLLAPGGGADHPAAGGQGRPLNVGDIPDGDLWEIHMRCKREMIEFVRNQLEKQYVQRGYSGVRVRKLQETLDANFLTIVFARRFAAYKRPTLILADKERLHRILSDSDRPVQLIFTGKAHPADGFGKGMIKEIIDFARDFEVEDRVIFLENYDMEVAEQLVRGADIWLNSPLKPFEASGTSGMKAGMNGVLNLSVLDGWWPECFNGENGWAVESGDMQAHRETRDAVESNQIYDLLEEEIVPLYYDRNERDLPSRWVEMMKKSMTTLLDRFTINRMLGEYMDRYYAPAVRNLQALLGDGLVTLRKSLAAADKIREVWSKVDIREIRTDIDGRGVTTTGDTVGVSCRVSLDDADPDLFGVQIFYYREREDEYAAIPLEFVERDGAKVGLFRGHFTLTSSGVQGFSVRLVPADETVRALFPELIKWQRF